MNIFMIAFVMVLLSLVVFCVMKLEWFLERCDTFSEELPVVSGDVSKEMWK